MTKRPRRRRHRPDRSPHEKSVASLQSTGAPTPSRRSFISRSGLMFAGGVISTALPASESPTSSSHPLGSRTLKVGLVGCGQFGIRSANEVLQSENGDIQLTAVADAFPHAIQKAYRTLNGKHREKVNLGDRRFSGIDAYQQLMQTDVDLVILAAPPSFCPDQFEFAIAKRKHVLLSPPIGMDVQSIRSITQNGELAHRAGMVVASGFPHRHDPIYQDCITKIHEGMIGPLVRADIRSVRIQSPPRRQRASESLHDYRLNHWRHDAKWGGELADDQHLQNLDLINWAFREHPVEAQSVPGDASQLPFDTVEFRYPNGMKLRCQRVVRSATNNTAETSSKQRPHQITSPTGGSTARGVVVHGTDGSCDVSNGIIRNRGGKVIWQSSRLAGQGQSARHRGARNQYDQLISAIRAGTTVPSGLEETIPSVLTAIMGRTASRQSATVTWGQMLDQETAL